MIQALVYFFIQFSSYSNCIYILYPTEISGFLISYFTSKYSLDTLLTKTKLSRLIQESIKALQIKTLVVSNLIFVNSTILLCYFIFFLMIELYFLMSAVNAEFFNATP